MTNGVLYINSCPLQIYDFWHRSIVINFSLNAISAIKAPKHPAINLSSLPGTMTHMDRERHFNQMASQTTQSSQVILKYSPLNVKSIEWRNILQCPMDNMPDSLQLLQLPIFHFRFQPKLGSSVSYA